MTTTEQAAGRPKDERRYVLRLYIAGMSPRSRRAVSNLHSICDRYLDARADVEVIDLYQNVDKAALAQILGAPTLVRELPEPVRRLIGDLSDEKKVIAALELVDDEEDV